MSTDLPTIKSPQDPNHRAAKIVLDWKAYFIEFCRAHGEPVEYKGRLLFQDGWTYSSSDFGGPEWEPPTDNDELDRIVTSYWLIRLAGLNRKLTKLLVDRDSLNAISHGKSMPLQQVTMFEDEEKKKRRGYKPLDTTALDSKIAWVREDVAEAETRLKELEEYHGHRRRDPVPRNPDGSVYVSPAQDGQYATSQ